MGTEAPIVLCNHWRNDAGDAEDKEDDEDDEEEEKDEEKDEEEEYDDDEEQVEVEKTTSSAGTDACADRCGITLAVSFAGKYLL